MDNTPGQFGGEEEDELKKCDSQSLIKVEVLAEKESKILERSLDSR